MNLLSEVSLSDSRICDIFKNQLPSQEKRAHYRGKRAFWSTALVLRVSAVQINVQKGEVLV